MKRSTIWTIAIVMGVSLMGLLVVQLSYVEKMAQMKQEQFKESVTRALYQAAHNLELNETLYYLEKDIKASERHALLSDSVSSISDALNAPVQKSHQASYTGDDGTIYTSFELHTLTLSPKKEKQKINKGLMVKTDKNPSITEAQRTIQRVLKQRYTYQKALLDEVVYSILYTASDKPLKTRINFKQLDQDIRAELRNNGVDIQYHFRVNTYDGREIYRCPDYDDEGKDLTFAQTLFKNDPQQRSGTLLVHFPDINSYIFSSVRFMIPALIFTLILLVAIIFIIYLVLREKKVSEIRTDFVNNMTHELKTPISSISLAAQMLNDTSITKNEKMMAHLSGVINDETKRLRFLVEKVLQMSLFNKKKMVFKMKEMDINELVENVAHSFSLRVEHTGGKVYTDIAAVDSTIFVEETHFSNVIFNLMDNAVKYCKPEEPLNIYLSTWNEGQKVFVSIRDTGIGIKKENVKKIFDQFYRVHTGNRHDVKGFGLGLAYVKKVIDLHKGTITVDSDFGKGTTFTISLDFVQE